MNIDSRLSQLHRLKQQIDAEIGTIVSPRGRAYSPPPPFDFVVGDFYIRDIKSHSQKSCPQCASAHSPAKS